MWKDTKVVAHEGTGSNMCIFYKRGYEDGYYSTLPIGTLIWVKEYQFVKKKKSQ